MTKFLNTIFVISCILCIGSIFAYTWVNNNADKHVPIISNMFGNNTQVSDDEVNLDPDSKHTWVVKLFRNIDGNGSELFEIKQTTYTDYQLSNVYSTGVQVLNPSALELGFVHTGKELNIFAYEKNYYTYRYKNVDNVDYFNSVDGISFAGTDKLTSLNDDLYIIDIDGKPYAFNYMKTIQGYHSQSLWVSLESYVTSNFDYFMYQLYGTAKSLKQGIYNNLPIKFTDVFNIFEYNSTTGKFDKQTDMAQIDDYVSFRFYVYDRGVMTHSDSLFGQIGETAPGGVIYG